MKSEVISPSSQTIRLVYRFGKKVSFLGTYTNHVIIWNCTLWNKLEPVPARIKTREGYKKTKKGKIKRPPAGDLSNPDGAILNLTASRADRKFWFLRQNLGLGKGRVQHVIIDVDAPPFCMGIV